MIKNFSSLLLLCSLSSLPVVSQTIDRQIGASASRAETEAASPGNATIRLNPANKYNVAPEDAKAWMEATTFTGNHIARNVIRRSERIQAVENSADSVVCYGIYKPTDGDPTSLNALGIYTFHASKTFDFYDETGGISLPDATCYAWVEGKYWLFGTGKIDIYDAKTGEAVESGIAFQLNGEDVTPMQACTYDPLTGMIYVVYWGANYSKALLKIDPTTYEVSEVGSMPGYPLSIAAAPDGKLYFISYPSSLYSLDKETGAYELVNSKALAGKGYQNATASQTAAFDWSTGMMYLTNLTQDWNTHLSKIDPKTGNATDIADFPGKERIVGLFIPYADADSPGFASEISYVNGKLNFTVPSTTYSSGKQLTGNLTAYITADRSNAMEMTVTPGQKVTMDYALADGSHIVEIEMGNTAGKSPARRLNTFIGTDIPCAVTELTLSIDDGKNAVLTWKAPTTSVNGGPVEEASINYTIIRYPDEVPVATGFKGTSFTQAIPDAHARYYYTVTAYADNKAGETATSNIVPAGSTWYAPYIETFDTQADFDSFKLVDANNDGKTWQYSYNQLQGNGYAYLQGNGTANVDTGIYEGNGNDDYLVSPSISLKKDIDYRISFETYDQWMTVEHLTLLLGKKKDVVGDEKEIASLDIRSSVNEYTILFNVEEDGLYNLLLHADSPGQSVNMCLDNLSFDIYSSFEGPDCVSSINAVAGEKGALSNTLTVTAPTKTYKGNALGSISYINVYRNGSAKPAHVFDAPRPGETLVWEDTDVEQGSVTYRVVAFNEQGQGKEALVTNWVGLDAPADVTNLKVVMNSDFKAVVTYDKVTGIGKHGGYVDPDEVQYVLCRYNEYNYMNHWEEVTGYTSGLTLTDETFSPYYGARQQYVDYLLVAANSAGQSDGAGTGIVLGEPYERPYTESFASGAVENEPWTLSASSYYYAWETSTGSGIAVKPYDGDEGMLMFTYIYEESNTQVMMGPRISLANAASAELSFYMYHGFEAEEGDLTLKVYTNYDDEGWENTANVEYNNGADGWSRFSLPLRSGAKDVQIAFGAYAADASASIYVDAIKIDESVEKDLAVESILIDSKRIKAGEGTSIKVSVANYGVTTAEGFKVVLSRDGEKCQEAGSTALAQNQVADVRFDITTTKADAAKSYVYQATIEYEGDANAENDYSQEVRLYVVGSNLPTAENLTGSASNGSVTLTWEQPSKQEVADSVTDDFDSYESFIIDGIGDWKTYDGDGTPTAYFNGPQIAHAYEAKAWQVWAPVEAGFSLEKFDVLTPHSGDKYLTCWAASDGVTTVLPNDDWLISSDIIGGTDVSFYYRMPNDGSDPQVFEMMYSTTDQEPENFTAFDRDSIVSTTDWVRFEYTLPEDAKYFAVRSCSKGSYTVAFLDDITYTPLYGSTTAVTLTGYNVYRDNELIAENLTGLSYTDNEAGSESRLYNVTAVWKEGESNFSNGYLSNGDTGIEAGTDSGNIRVAGLKNAISVQNAAGEPVRIFTFTGQTLFSGVASDNMIIEAVQGAYLVQAGSATFKVFVR